MERRAFIAGGLALLAVPLVVEAQPGKVWRIAYLGGGSPATTSSEAFVQELRRRGWSDGQNLTIVYRWAEGRGYDRLADLGREMLSLNPDVIVLSSFSASGDLPVPTRTIPVVVSAFDRLMGTDPNRPLRPLGNVTGVNLMAGELAGTQLQLLQEMLPRARRVAVLRRPESYSAGGLQEAATALKLQTPIIEITEPNDFADIKGELVRVRADAALVQPHDLFLHHRQLVIDLLKQSRLPAIFPAREYVELGGLMAYGPSTTDIQKGIAGTVDRLMRGAKVAELPMEQATKFELVMNLKTAKSLELTIPPAVLSLANEIIQ